MKMTLWVQKWKMLRKARETGGADSPGKAPWKGWLTKIFLFPGHFHLGEFYT